MRTFWEKYSSTIYRMLIICALLLFIYLFVTVLLPFLAPFIIAIIIAMLIEPLVKLLEKRLRVPRKIGSLISLLLFIVTIGALIFLASNKIYHEVLDLKGNIGIYITQEMIPQIETLYNKAYDLYGTLDPQLVDNITNVLKEFGKAAPSIIDNVYDFATSAIRSIPKIMFFTIITLVSSYFMNADKNKINAFVFEQFHPAWESRIHSIRLDILKALFGYLKAISILMTITFLELITGLSIIGVKYSIILATLIALVDVLPVLGTGTVLIPWLMWEALAGRYKLAISLLVLYVVILVVRQTLEPKILAHQIGLHPLVTLLSMYIGVKIFGVSGILFGPVTVIFLKNLQRAGVIELWKHPPAEEKQSGS